MSGYVRLGILTAMVVSVFAVNARAQLYTEPYRPGYHFSPPQNWTNEPHGMMYLDGRYHIFYQHNPTAPVFDVTKASWGHAVSTDLVNWEHKPIALAVENGISNFTGSAVYDVNNTSGLGTLANPPMVLAYTGFNISTGVQNQHLAFSTDSGETFTKYSGNPVLVDPVNPLEARDPKVFWYEPDNSWKMVLAHGGQNRLSIWDSPDLKSWTFKSNFTDPAVSAAGATGWEVPDLVELPVDGNPNDKRWTMIWTPAQGSPAGGNGVMYAVGAGNATGGFDGSFFSREFAGTALWADYGKDFDGTQSWSNMPSGDDRVIHTGIMQAYGNDVPTSPWRGQFAIPRELGLTQTASGVRLTQTPVAEIESLREEQAILSNLAVAPGSTSLSGFGIEGEMLELVATFDPGTAFQFGLRVREGGPEHTEVGYFMPTSNMYVDRRDSGFDSWTPGFAAVHQAPLELDNGLVKLRMFVDRSTIEVFGGKGEAVISDLIFPDAASIGVSAFSVGGTATLVSLEAYGMRDIWLDPLPSAPQTIVHWSMDAAGGSGNPVTLDSATAFGQGSTVGPNNHLDPGTNMDDHLWTFNDRQQIGGVVNEYVTSSETAPTTMFAPGFSGGASSYDAGAIDGVNGALFLPADVYGDELNFADSFSLEMVFKSDGDQSAGGVMQLLSEGENEFRYGLTLNEGSAGNLRFTLSDKSGSTPELNISDVTGRNFADGQWHYLLATYDANAGTNGEMSLTILNEDGSVDIASLDVGGAFSGLTGDVDGNFFIGRRTFAHGVDPRTFLGLIDEVRISSGVITSELAMGALPTGLAGDLDGDGFVGINDLNIVLGNWNQNVPPGDPLADPSGDGFVGIDDLNLVLGNWNAGTPPAEQTGNIPEPASLLLFSTGISALLRRSGRC